jgi:hypothetical protein
MLENDTRNQHFLTRVEQKLNALNPQAADRNLRIYSDDVGAIGAADWRRVDHRHAPLPVRPQSSAPRHRAQGASQPSGRDPTEPARAGKRRKRRAPPGAGRCVRALSQKTMGLVPFKCLP